ncbi:MAG: mechanosensitive ion channel family protein [Cellvibrionaceae bacterium]|nr:mechanosensitive ion channel family protein [Cellvibrionaceae bacterium]
MSTNFQQYSAWFNYAHIWVLEVFFLVFITLLIAFFVRRFVERLEGKTRLTKNLWDDGLIDALKQPLNGFIWMLGISFAADLVSLNTESSFQGLVTKFREIATIIIVTWFSVRLIKRLETNLTSAEFQQKPMDKTTARAMGKLLRASVSITAILIIMQSMGYSISGILAFGGIGGLAVGFAAKDLLANFFGGLMIYLDRPFKVGDWVRSPDQEIEGTVEDIGWRLTRIRTFDKRPLYVPNATFAQISLENPSRMLNRRIKETIGIRYDDANKMDTIVSQVKSMLENHQDIDSQQTLIVNFNAFAPSSLDFFIYTFTKTTDWIEFHKIKQDVLLKIIAIIEKNGAECAFPTSTLHIASNSSLRPE